MNNSKCIKARTRNRTRGWTANRSFHNNYLLLQRTRDGMQVREQIGARARRTSGTALALQNSAGHRRTRPQHTPSPNRCSLQRWLLSAKATLFPFPRMPYLIYSRTKYCHRCCLDPSVTDNVSLLRFPFATTDLPAASLLRVFEYAVIFKRSFFHPLFAGNLLSMREYNTAVLPLFYRIFLSLTFLSSRHDRCRGELTSIVKRKKNPVVIKINNRLITSSMSII